MNHKFNITLEHNRNSQSDGNICRPTLPTSVHIMTYTCIYASMSHIALQTTLYKMAVTHVVSFKTSPTYFYKSKDILYS